MLRCLRNRKLLYEYEWTCIVCECIIINKKNELTIIQRKKLKFINRLKHAAEKIICLCIGVYKMNEGEDFNHICNIL